MVEAWYLNELQKNLERPDAGVLQSAKEKIWQGIQPPRRRVIPFLKWAAVAASVAVAGLLIYNFGKHTKTDKRKQELVAKTVKPVKEDQGEEIVASKIENKMVKLTDGSIVILEKGSKLRLLPAFDKKHNREVELEGKAFFDIAHNRLKPFIIYAGTIRTTVLGTAFDVTAIPNSGFVKVNVIRGLVEVKGSKSGRMTYLKKNMQVIFNANDSIVVRKSVNAAKELSWNKTDLEFNDISLADAKSRLEEQFGYKIIVRDPELQKSTFAYSMRATESAESFIKSICAFIGASYTIDHKNNIISIQPLNQ